MFEWYCRISIWLMCVWVAYIVLADLCLFVFNIENLGVRSVNPLNWVIVFLLLPFVNILFLYIIYRLYTKGSCKVDRSKSKQRGKN